MSIVDQFICIDSITRNGENICYRSAIDKSLSFFIIFIYLTSTEQKQIAYSMIDLNPPETR